MAAISSQKLLNLAVARGPQRRASVFVTSSSRMTSTGGSFLVPISGRAIDRPKRRIGRSFLLSKSVKSFCVSPPTGCPAWSVTTTSSLHFVLRLALDRVAADARAQDDSAMLPLSGGRDALPAQYPSRSYRAAHNRAQRALVIAHLRYTNCRSGPSLMNDGGALANLGRRKAVFSGKIRSD